jgi:hypothetical protein
MLVIIALILILTAHLFELTHLDASCPDCAFLRGVCSASAEGVVDEASGVLELTARETGQAIENPAKVADGGRPAV